ncbi:hypothetical protein EWI61_04495 [Methylolobus aquaticus]|nr:hypothetical protein EWI61_04495 [Methylolobus aquaticus]
MDVKPGYKQTDVGVIPDDWCAVPVGDLFSFKNGLNKAKQFFGYGTPIVNYMDVFGRACLHVKDVVGRVDVSPRELAAYEVCKGDVFFTRTSETVEEIGVASVMLDEPERTVFSGFILRARPSDQSLDNTFKAYCFTPYYFRQQVISRASYTTRALTNGRSLSAVILVRPPIPEQRAIAGALSDVDALIAKLDQLIAKKRDLKQAAMQELLTGRRRLPGFQGEWGMSTVGAEFEVKLGKMLDGARNVGVPKPYLGNKAVQWGRIDTRDLSTVPLSRQEIESLRLYKGDLLVCEGGEIGRAAIWMAPIDECYYQKALHRLRPRRGFKPELMACLLRHWADSGLLANFATQTSIAHLPREKLLQIPLPVPTQQEQTAIATVLSDMDAEVTALEARRDKTKLLKQGMMQELLTGRIRLV